MQNPNAFRWGKNVCAYCGASPAPQREHVVGRCFFPKPLPDDNNLIIVAACDACNHGLSSSLNDDEDYTSGFMINTFGAGFHPSAISRLEGPFRKSLRTGQGQARQVLNGLRRVETITESGLFIGYHEGLKGDFKRIKRVLEKITRGLHYHETGEIVPGTSQVKKTLFFDKTGKPNFDNFFAISNLARSFPGCQHIPDPKSDYQDNVIDLIGDTFTYWAVLSPDRSFGVWFLSFYNGAFLSVVNVSPISACETSASIP